MVIEKNITANALTGYMGMWLRWTRLIKRKSRLPVVYHAGSLFLVG